MVIRKVNKLSTGGGYKNNYKINYLKAIAIILVVLGHAMSYYSEIHNVSNFFRMVMAVIYSIHVPLFLMIAGFLCHQQDKKKFLVKKIKRILIPFFTFSILKLLYSNFISIEFIHENTIIKQLVDAFIFGNLYWFAYSILIMYFLTAILWNIKKIDKRKKIIIIAISTMVIYSIFSDIIGYSFLPKIFQIKKTIRYFPYFLLGYYFQIDSEKKIKSNYNTKVYVLALIVIIVCSILYYKGVNPDFILVKYILSLALFLVINIIVDILPKGMTILNKIGVYSYQIMLFDSFYKAILFMIFKKYFYINIFSVILISIINIILSLFSCNIIEKIPYINVLFGLNNEKSK